MPIDKKGDLTLGELLNLGVQLQDLFGQKQAYSYAEPDVTYATYGPMEQLVPARKKSELSRSLPTPSEEEVQWTAYQERFAPKPTGGKNLAQLMMDKIENVQAAIHPPDYSRGKPYEKSLMKNVAPPWEREYFMTREVGEKEPISVHMPSYAKLVELAGISGTGILPSSKGRKKVEKELLEKMYKGDVPGGMVSYFFPRTQQVSEAKESLLRLLPSLPPSQQRQIHQVLGGGSTIAGRFSIGAEAAPDTVKLYDDPKLSSRRRLTELISALFHEPFHASSQKSYSGIGFAHVPGTPYTEDFFDQKVVDPLFQGLSEKYKMDDVLDMFSVLVSGEAIDFKKYKQKKK